MFRFSEIEIATMHMREGRLHRLDDPARHSDEREDDQFFIHGKRYAEQEYWCHPLVIKHMIDEINELNNEY